MNDSTAMGPATLGSRIGHWYSAAQRLASKAGCIREMDATNMAMRHLDRAAVSVALLGSPNSGKSMLINRLLERHLLRVTPIASHVAYRIEASSSSAHEWARVRGHLSDQSVNPEKLVELVTNPGDAEVFWDVAVAHPWLQESSYVLIERPAIDASDDDSGSRVEGGLQGADVALLVVDALGPINHSETHILAQCAHRRIPLLAVTTKLDLLADEERRDVIAYVTKQVAAHSQEFSAVRILHWSSDDAYSRQTIKTVIRELSQPDIIRDVRLRQVSLALHDLLQGVATAAHAELLSNAVDGIDQAATALMPSTNRIP
jgi:GTP-binding protein EngB required for normal cell division